MKKINKKGLTLIELLAVIAIIAILFVLLIPQINSAINKARVSGVQTDLHSYEIGIKSHLMENIAKTPTEESINNNLDKPLQFTNGKSKELNPYGNPYELKISPDGEVQVISKDAKSEPEYYNLVLKNDNGSIVSEIIEEKGIKEEVNDEFCGLTATDPVSNFSFLTYSEKTYVVGYKGTNTTVVFPCKNGDLDVIGIQGGGMNMSQGVITSGFEDKVFDKIILPSSYTIIGEYSLYKMKVNTVEYHNASLTFPSKVRLDSNAVTVLK